MDMSGPRRPYPLLVAGAVALVAAIWAGLNRSGWTGLPVWDHHPLAHGPLMICGFLGTLISLEKAMAVGRRWAFAGPALAGLGGLWLIARSDPMPAAVLFVVASFLLAAVFVTLSRRHLDLAGVVMLTGAVAWLAGNLLWLTGRSIPLIVPWWMAFPTLVIVGERLELSRVVSPPRSALILFFGSLSLYLFGLGLFLQASDTGLRLQGAGLLLLAGWLLSYDLARRTVRLAGRHRYTALCLLTGYFWLAVSAAMCLIWGIQLGGLRYDAVLHSLLVGFVFGMIFGHAPIIAPMLLGRNLTWGRQFYIPLALLQVSLVLRILGDLGQWYGLRSIATLGNALAILLFLMITARAAITGQRLMQ